MTDGMATLRFAVLDAVAGSWGSSVEEMVSAIVEGLKNPSIAWALEEVNCSLPRGGTRIETSSGCRP